MNCWQGNINRGIHSLNRHAPGAALQYFCHALSDCPVSNSAELSRLLFYLGVTLKRMGFSNSAVRSWLASQRLKKRDTAKKMLKRFSNPYGMAKQGCEEQDDWQAFYSIQVLRYLKRVNRRSIADAVERRLLREIILGTWEELAASGCLAGKSSAQKCEIFRSLKIDFPFFFYPGSREAIVPVDFFSGKKLKGEERCLCGSGLPFLACCGRTPGEDELSTGCF